MPTLKSELAKVFPSDGKTTQRVTFTLVNCECGKPMKYENDAIWCDRESCEHQGKRFRLPSVEVREV